MSKSIGLKQHSKKMLEFSPYAKGTPAVLFMRRGEGFYRMFRYGFGDGSEVIDGLVVPNLESLGECLVACHLALEMLLKAIIAVSKQPIKTHDLIELLGLAAANAPRLTQVLQIPAQRLLLEELSKSFDGIRYAEGTICLRHNAQAGWQNKKPLEEFSQLLEQVYQILLRECRRVVLWDSLQTPAP